MAKEIELTENQPSRYINPFTDFGFKKIFGEEPNKDLLIDFLNQLLAEQGLEIKDLTYKKTDHLGATDLDRKVVFDLYCENNDGEKFIVEMQKAKQKYFKDRTLYYSTFPIQEQGIKGKEWDYQLKAVFAVAVLDFAFDDEDKKETIVNRVQLIDKADCTVFYDKLTFIFVQILNFNKNIDQLETRLDKWLYVLKNLEKFDRIPEKIKDRIFRKVFKIAEYQALSQNERAAYHDSVKYYRDLKNSLVSAELDGFTKAEKLYQQKLEKERKLKEEALEKEKAALEKEQEERKLKEEALAKEKEERKLKEEALQKEKTALAKEKAKSIKLAIKMLHYNEPIEDIIRETGLSREEIEKLKDDSANLGDI